MWGLMVRLMILFCDIFIHFLVEYFEKKIWSKLYFPGPLKIKTKHNIQYKIANSGNSLSIRCFIDATSIVVKSKTEAERVNNPNTINSAPIDSENDAMKPKNVLKNSKPIKSVRALANLFHFSVPAVILFIP